MYDGGALQALNDRWWAVLKRALDERGFGTPLQLHRGAELLQAWSSPQLLLGQTCGLPFVRYLREQVQLVATTDYGIDGCPPGWYCSVIVVRRDDARQRVADFAGATAALNHIDSLSGTLALLHQVTEIAGPDRFFEQLLVTGAHVASMHALAASRADIAAIDAVSWQLEMAHGQATEPLRVLALTEPAPGLPIISAANPSVVCRQCDTVSADSVSGGEVVLAESQPELLAEALDSSLQHLPPELRQALGIRGFARLQVSDYDLIQQWDTASHASAISHGLVL